MGQSLGSGQARYLQQATLRLQAWSADPERSVIRVHYAPVPSYDEKQSPCLAYVPMSNPAISERVQAYLAQRLAYFPVVFALGLHLERSFLVLAFLDGELQTALNCTELRIEPDLFRREYFVPVSELPRLRWWIELCGAIPEAEQ